MAAGTSGVIDTATVSRARLPSRCWLLLAPGSASHRRLVLHGSSWPGHIHSPIEPDGRTSFMTKATRHTSLGPVRADSAVLLLVDQQEGLFSQIHEPGYTRASLLALARSARLL